MLIGGDAAAHDDAVEVGERRVSAAQLDCARHSVLQMPDGHVLRSGETRKEECARGAEEVKKKNLRERLSGGCPSSRRGTGNGKTKEAEVRGWTRTPQIIRGNVEFVRRSLGRGAGVESERDTCQAPGKKKIEAMCMRTWKDAAISAAAVLLARGEVRLPPAF